MALAKYDEGVEPGHGWAEKRDLVPRDAYLRRHGFHIHARPRGGPAIWEFDRSGVLMTEQEAVDYCDRAFAEAMAIPDDKVEAV